MARAVARIRSSSAICQVWVQAGCTIAALTRQGQSATAGFGGEIGKVYYLERSRALGATPGWQDVAGPLSGTNRLQSLTDTTATETRAYYRLRIQ